MDRETARRYESLKDAADMLAKIGDDPANRRDGGSALRFRIELRLLRSIEDLEDKDSPIPVHRANASTEAQ